MRKYCSLLLVIFIGVSCIHKKAIEDKPEKEFSKSGNTKQLQGDQCITAAECEKNYLCYKNICCKKCKMNQECPQRYVCYEGICQIKCRERKDCPKNAYCEKGICRIVIIYKDSGKVGDLCGNGHSDCEKGLFCDKPKSSKIGMCSMQQIREKKENQKPRRPGCLGCACGTAGSITVACQVGLKCVLFPNDTIGTCVREIKGRPVTLPIK